MFRYIIKRLLQMIPLLIIISLITFGISKLAPGDYLSVHMADPSWSAARIAAERHRLGLDQPIFMQYLIWAGNFVRGNMGDSFRYSAPVSSLIGQRLLATLSLGVSSLLFTWLVAIPLGIYASVRKYTTTDKAFSLLTFTALGIPDFFLALMLLFLSVKTGLLPAGGMTGVGHDQMSWLGQALDIAHHMILPTIAVSIGTVAIYQRRMRGNLLDVLAEDYIRMARAKGLPENKVIYKHALRNAINPMVTLLGYDLAALLSGFALVENVIGWPGLGNMMLEALQAMDMPLAMAGMMIGALMLLLGNLVADLLLAMVDPRIQLEA
ncbi:MAG TPA: ABC transporter permease [Oscillatoriaceae cyanobacterium]